MKRNKNTELVILVHGFFKNYKDMLPLQKHLSSLQYQCHIVDLPTTFGSFETCYESFKIQLSSLNIDYNKKKVHFVGHSMGGLIIRYYLSKHEVPNLGRCVLIGTPNKGTRLADIGAKVPLGKKILKPIEILKSDKKTIDLPLNKPLPEFGIIAGSDHRLVTGFLLEKPNDGRVEVEATKMDKQLMKAFKVLPFVHTKIHDQLETAKLVDNFLQEGIF